jgi:hypothetical protein
MLCTPIVRAVDAAASAGNQDLGPGETMERTRVRPLMTRVLCWSVVPALLLATFAVQSAQAQSPDDLRDQLQRDLREQLQEAERELTEQFERRMAQLREEFQRRLQQLREFYGRLLEMLDGEAEPQPEPPVEPEPQPQAPPTLGVEIGELTPEVRRMLDLDDVGVLVLRVVEGMPAAGVLRVNDVIVSVNRKPIGTIDQMRAAVQSHNTAEPMEIRLIRSGRELTVKVLFAGGEDDGRSELERELDDAWRDADPDGGEADPAPAPNAGTGWIGFTVAPSASPDEPGLYVTNIVDRGPAWRAGVLVGDRIIAVGGVDLTDNAGLRKALATRGPRRHARHHGHPRRRKAESEHQTRRTAVAAGFPGETDGGATVGDAGPLPGGPLPLWRVALAAAVMMVAAGCGAAPRCPNVRGRHRGCRRRAAGAPDGALPRADRGRPAAADRRHAGCAARP